MNAAKNFVAGMIVAIFAMALALFIIGDVDTSAHRLIVVSAAFIVMVPTMLAISKDRRIG